MLQLPLISLFAEYLQFKILSVNISLYVPHVQQILEVYASLVNINRSLNL
jgi:hypothetical protein